MGADIELFSIDAYGTIFDMTPVYRNATQAIVNRFAPGFPVERLSRTWSRRFMALYHAQTECRQPPAPFPTIRALTCDSLRETCGELDLPGDPELGTAIWVEHLQTIPLYADVLPALNSLRTRYRLILTSDSDEHIIRPALDRWNLPFERTFVSESCRTYKMAQAAGLLEHALQELNVDPLRVVHVGDSEADLIAAERAGCRGVWLKRPGHPTPHRHPWRTIESLHELQDLATP